MKSENLSNKCYRMILETVCQRTENFIQQMPKEQRKQYGQFFTSLETARFMATLVSADTKRKQLTVLDAGAGSGILSVALAERMDCILDKGQTLRMVCYENDPNILPLLHDNLETVRCQCNFRLEYEIRTANYILSQADALDRYGLFSATSELEKYDIIIGNPPYKKVAKDAPEARLLPEVCYGAPNLYFLFATMGVKNLRDGGEMVYIIPRSWTSGAYFERFRKWLFAHATLEYIHLFTSRDKVFDKESVLQETMIVRLCGGVHPQPTVTISTTTTSHDFSQRQIMSVPTDTVVAGNSRYVFLPTNKGETNVLHKFSTMRQTLTDIGLRMKTGLVVDFRSRDLLRDKPTADTIPLIYSCHIKDGRVRFPQGKEGEYLLRGRTGFMQPNHNYLFVKRFTAKEEHRRLQCGIYLSRYQPDYHEISSQNKVNFIDSTDSEMSECLVYGLYTIFNSTLYDTYYRILNGSTQVNATEINSMPVPPIGDIMEMGKHLLMDHDLSERHCDEILNTYIQ